jgi:RNA 3'-terminal phosphate cyclase (ATP)
LSEQIIIDGSAGEGGGQIIRTAAAIAATTGRPLAVNNVRARRKRPGLQRQHVCAIEAIARLCKAETQGVELDSEQFSLEPTEKVTADDLEIEVGTAGSTTLILQALLVPLSFASGESRLRITGGTHNPLAPTFDYLDQVFRPLLLDHGFDFDLELIKAGFYPKGGGEITATIRPLQNPRPFSLETKSPVKEPQAKLVRSGMPDRLRDTAESLANQRFSLTQVSNLEDRSVDSLSPGFGFFIHADGDANYAGFSAIGGEHDDAERAINKALDYFEEYLEMDAPVDPFLADQVALPAAFLPGRSVYRTVRSTQHLRTVLALVNRWMYEETTLLQEPFGTWRVEVAGSTPASS